jgi:hypothetical protein
MTLDGSIIGWLCTIGTTIAVVAVGYGRVQQKVDSCMKKLEDGLPKQVAEHEARLTRVETILEVQQTQFRRMEAKVDMLLCHNGIDPADTAKPDTIEDKETKALNQHEV